MAGGVLVSLLCVHSGMYWGIHRLTWSPYTHPHRWPQPPVTPSFCPLPFTGLFYNSYPACDIKHSGKPPLPPYLSQVYEILQGLPLWKHPLHSLLCSRVYLPYKAPLRVRFHSSSPQTQLRPHALLADAFPGDPVSLLTQRSLSLWNPFRSTEVVMATLGPSTQSRRYFDYPFGHIPCLCVPLFLMACPCDPLWVPPWDGWSCSVWACTHSEGLPCLGV